MDYRIVHKQQAQFKFLQFYVSGDNQLPRYALKQDLKQAGTSPRAFISFIINHLIVTSLSLFRVTAITIQVFFRKSCFPTN